MTKHRSYKLQCPIARGLDRIGDRWTLLILRDLHAGPARFTDLQRGLTGIAANLLTERLAKLVEDGIIRKTSGPHATTLYELTDLGHKTQNLIFELAMFGAQFPSETDIVDPGNLGRSGSDRAFGRRNRSVHHSTAALRRLPCSRTNL